MSVKLSSPPAVQYWDSLPEPHELCALNAQRVLDLLWPGQTLPPRTHSVFQKGSECGFYVLGHILEICAELRGEGPASRGWTAPLIMDLMASLKTWVGQLAGEQKKLISAEAAERKGLAATLKKNLARSLALAKTASAAAGAVDAAAALAAKVLSEGKEPELSDLSAEDQEKISQIELTGIGICARCRWASGCLSCSADKARRFYLNKLRVSLGLKPLR
mgnify:CR=1 FL=1